MGGAVGTSRIAHDERVRSEVVRADPEADQDPVIGGGGAALCDVAAQRPCHGEYGTPTPGVPETPTTTPIRARAPTPAYCRARGNARQRVVSSIVSRGGRPLVDIQRP